MRIIAILVLVFGVALAGGALFYASEYFKDLKASMVQQGPKTVRVLVAKQALQYGTKIEPKNLRWVEWPKSAVPPGAFTSVEELLGKKGGEKRIVLRAIDPGEPLLEGKLTKLGESPRMSMNLGAGRRAVSISIDAISGVSGFVAAGDRVDILLTRTQQDQLTSSVILQDITVIAVDQRSNSEAASPRVGRTVTVEVDTVQAQKLALAQQVGRLSLTLRGLGESVDEIMKPVTARELSDFDAPEVAPEFKVRVRRAGSLKEVDVGEPSSAVPGAVQSDNDTAATNN
jgi:pilus assembly protein CpaB